MHASMRRTWRAQVAAAALAVIAGLVSAPSATVAGGGSWVELDATAPISGLGPRWTFDLSAEKSKFGPGHILALSTNRSNPAGTANASFRVTAFSAELSCTGKLGTCELSAGEESGDYALVQLTFTATAPRTQSETFCSDGATLHGITYRRVGILTGQLRVKTHIRSLGVIRNGSGDHQVPASLPATVTREAWTGAHCAPPLQCPELLVLDAREADLSGSRRLPNGQARMSWWRTLGSSTPHVSRQELVRWSGPGAQVLVVNTPQTLGSAVVDTTRAGPFITGGALHAAGQPLDSDYSLGGCPATRRKGAMLISMTVDLPWRAPFQIDDEVPSTLYHQLP